jgi:hypothetical protein
MMDENIYIPFENRYIMYKILNYGKSYSNYTTYKLFNKKDDDIETIYIDNQTCITPDKEIEFNLQNLPYYVEIHYNKTSGKNKFETIMKKHEIYTLLEKYFCG